MFIELHDYGDGSPMLINVEDLIVVSENTVFLRNREVTAQEGYEEIKSMLIGGTK